MTDLPTTTQLPAVPTRRVLTVRAPHRGHGRWGWVIILAVTDAIVAMFLLGSALGALFPSDLADRGSASRSVYPSPAATGGGALVAVDAGGGPRQEDGRAGGASRSEVTATSTTAQEPVVPDAAPTRGQTPVRRGPVGGPASTTTTAP